MKLLSIKNNTPLLVIGALDRGSLSSKIGQLLNLTYKHGDFCLDINGCSCKNSIKEDIYIFLKKQKSKSFIIFISCVLDYIDNIDLVFKEIKRVSDDNFKIVYINNLIEFNFLGSYYENNKFLKRKNRIIKITKNNIIYK
jgi:hypothetical protein